MRRLPSYDDVSDLPSAPPVTVPPEYGDLNGHMNVRSYLGIYDNAEWAIYGGMGIGAAEAEAGIGGVFALEQHITYRREVLVGDRVTVRLRVVGRAGALLHLVSYLANDTRSEVAGCMEALEGWVDFGTRRLAPFPESAARALDDLAAQAAALTWAPELSGSMRV